MKKKVKRYQEGGVTINQQAPAPTELPGLAGYGGSTNTYPFQSSGSAPSAQAEQPATTMKRGGKVSSASRRGDGCAIRGKTRA